MNLSEVLFVYKQTGSRARAGAGNRYEAYSLFGLNDLQAEGLPVKRFDFEEPSRLQRWMAALLRRWCERVYNNGGNFQGILAGREELSRAGGIVATSNSVAISLLLLKKWGWLKAPVFVISVGLELHAIRPSKRRRRRLAKLFQEAEKILVFSEAEKDYLVQSFGMEARKIVGQPYGISVEALPDPVEGTREEWDILSVGADWMRDFSLLIRWGERHPEVSIRMVVESSRLHTLGELPANVTVETDLPLEEVFDRVSRSHWVVIPVKQNPYTAGTTFLIHAMAMGRPVLVAKTASIDERTRLADGEDCLFYEPENEEDFGEQLDRAVGLSVERRNEIGKNAARWARRSGNGDRFRSEIAQFVRECAEG